METDSSNNLRNEEEQPERSIFGVIVHSFFIVPFLIAVFCVLLFVSIRILTVEEHTVYDYLEDVKTGGLSKRWQAAFELSKLLASPGAIADEERFKNELTSAFEHSKHDDNRVRQYLALAMARTGDSAFVDPILSALTSAKEDNLYALIYSLGILQDAKAAPELYGYLDHPNARIRLVTVIALGNIGDTKALTLLKKALNDPEPNVQWDAAIALAKLGDGAGKNILLNLLNRSYLEKFEEVDSQEQTHVMLVALDAASRLNDQMLTQTISELADSDKNIKVRKAALEIIQ